MPKLEVDKEDVISMVCGTIPYYKVWNNPAIKNLCVYSDKDTENWVWDVVKLNKLSGKELMSAYRCSKQSWK